MVITYRIGVKATVLSNNMRGSSNRSGLNDENSAQVTHNLGFSEKKWSSSAPSRIDTQLKLGPLL
ncbi:hypothetical protein KIN20_007002 [Parelaphostrongylus tenuis]|uniref:Uncharacterized protein n=1 Tax=Parelaphostrongylus tenuis TaxID=148309 RepID=A0AAD5M4M6_PARTN|nr:hypothetical protein KIN20_007002 [Parelaphostrongylus tenuis]